MNEIKGYAEQWNTSSQFFFDKKYYQWMCEKLTEFKTVLEIGCGTGYSTLALINSGHKVVAIEKNPECIIVAKKLIADNGYTKENVIFLEGDVADAQFREQTLVKYSCDIVICWNVGTYWSKQMIQYYVPYMLEYGLSISQIKENPESSYSELIIWDACRISNVKGVPIHIIDRSGEIINENTDPYFCRLKDEFHFSEIVYDNLGAESISSGGRVLITSGKVNQEGLVDIIFLSVLMK
jgi:SAM-dependent methyltransferase